MQFREFNEGRSRTRSEITKEKNVIESKKQRKERSRQIENENTSWILKIAGQVNNFLGGELSREFKDSRIRADGIKILTKGIVDCTNNYAKQKKLTEDASIEKEKPTFHSQEINFDVSSLHIRKIKYMGDVDENTKLPYGKGVVAHIRGAFSITGTFFQNYLDLREKIVIKGPYGEKYEFMGNKNFGREAMISMDDISKVNDIYNIDLPTICLKLLNDDGRNEYILFNPNFVY